jgi:hypothetical protein
LVITWGNPCLLFAAEEIVVEEAGGEKIKPAIDKICDRPEATVHKLIHFINGVDCNYGETGNILRRPVYKIGRACSSCPCATTCSNDYPGLCAPTNSSNHACCDNFLCMLNRPMNIMTNEITDMTMDTASEVGDAVMDTFHTTGGIAMNTAHGALNTAQGVGNIAMDTVQGVGNVAINTVDEVNKFVNSGFRPVTNFVNSGFNFFSPRFLNNNFFRGKK